MNQGKVQLEDLLNLLGGDKKPLAGEIKKADEYVQLGNNLADLGKACGDVKFLREKLKKEHPGKLDIDALIRELLA